VQCDDEAFVDQAFAQRSLEFVLDHRTVAPLDVGLGIGSRTHGARCCARGDAVSSAPACRGLSRGAVFADHPN
jgi:hypothetical protein